MELIKAEAKAKEDEAKRIEQKRLDDIEAELSKGDEEKFNDLVQDLIDLKRKYNFKSETYQKKNNTVQLLIDKIVLHVK